MRTVLTHFYNEEYLLPRWLEHHKKYFDFGILIDYGSTDRSVEICKDICPSWNVFPSRHQYFDARSCDEEVMFYEKQLPDPSWRIALTVTEFLVGNFDKHLLMTPARVQWLIPGIRFTDWNPDGTIDPSKPLWEQFSTGVSYISNPVAHQCRSLHNYNFVEYTPGRHWPSRNTEDLLIFHYAHCITGEPMLKRRLQIQDKVSPRDKEEGLGTHHFYGPGGLNRENLFEMHKNFIELGTGDCSDFIKRMIDRDPRISKI